MDTSIPFREAPFATHLSAAELHELEEHHPDGRARFWGAKPSFDRAIDQLSAGDLVLFTGESRLRFIGTLGFKTRNELLAEALWPRGADSEGWNNVYSVTTLQAVTDISYRQLARFLGYKEAYSFQPTQLLKPEQASRVIAGVGIDVSGLQEQGAATQRARRRKPGVANGLDQTSVEEALAEWRDLGKSDFLKKYSANAAEKYIVLAGQMEADAMAILLGARHRAGLPTEGPWRGDRSNVADPLRELGFAVANLKSELEAPLGPEPALYVTRAPEFLGRTDSVALRAVRREQSYLRGALGIGSGRPGAQAECALCGRSFPEDLLVAAHIKPRARCTEAERLDIPHIAMAACLLGCDALYERGYITIDNDGIIRSTRDPEESLAVRKLLDGRRIAIHDDRRASYFAWHRSKHMQPRS